ncbi:MAG TPA: sulfite exporter TauE/SafE family protein [Pirellulales bacterium]|nr:sulfite exporter TauE/SafE family protein [Pirellulales bacterium]
MSASTAILGNPVLLATGALALAGFVQGLTGFGFGLIAMGLLPLFLGLGEAQAIVTLTGIAGCVTMLGVTLAHVRWSNVVHLWIGSMLGVPLGFWVLTSLPQPVVMRLLGLTICLLVVFEIVITRRYAVRLPDWTGWGVGLASGALTGAFNIGGPPLVAYIFGRPWTKEQHVATLSAVFMSSSIIRVVLLLTHHDIDRQTWIASAWAVGPMLVAIVVGNRLLKYVSQQQLRTGVYITLLALGGHYLFA